MVDGFAIRINIVEDGEGPHVHVVKGGREYRVRLLHGETEDDRWTGESHACGSAASRADHSRKLERLLGGVE